MREARLANAPPVGVPLEALARLRAVDSLDPAAFSDLITDSMSATEERVRAVLGAEAVSAAAAAVGAFLADVLLETPVEVIIKRGGAAPAFARIVRELEAHPAGYPDVEAALAAIAHLPEEVGR